MHKIKLQASAIAIPVHSSIHAKKGDHLFVQDSGEIIVIDRPTYLALAKADLITIKKPKASPSVIELVSDKTKLKQKILEVLEEDSTTSTLMNKILGSHKPREYYDKVYNALESLEKRGFIEHVQVHDTNATTNRYNRKIRLWATCKTNQQPAEG